MAVKLLYQYTSRQLGQEIAISKKLKPGSGGKLYLTPDLYDRGYEAAGRLSLEKNVEVRCSLDEDDVPKPSEERLVEPLLDENGEEIRPGGGVEVWIHQEILLRGRETWNLLGAP